MALRPRMKWKINAITAKISRMWISPPATWNAVNPSSHAMNKTAHKIRNINLLSFGRSPGSGLTARNTAGQIPKRRVLVGAAESDGE